MKFLGKVKITDPGNISKKEEPGLENVNPVKVILRTGEDIVKEDYSQGCVFCGEMKTTTFKQKRLCLGCMTNLASLHPPREYTPEN